MRDIADRLELRELAEAYAFAADMRDRTAFSDVFTSEGVLLIDAGGRYEGRAEIAGVLDYLDDHYPRTLHFVGNHRVRLEGDRASGMVYCLAHHVYEREGVERDTLMATRYLDQYVRTPDGWKIAQRTHYVDWEEDRPLTT